ncbi:aldo/keto reductase [Nostocoides veronense]|uniref:Aldo/keto reductase n=1 Tax=Nostocoides veronense TaxID=330836 RepID=A0ABP4XVK1_9MICO
MEQRQLGNGGPSVSVIGLGCNNFSRTGRATETLEGTKAVLDAALDAGITLLDTADMYGSPATGSESLMGEALRGRREQVVLATKFGHVDYPIPGTEDWGPKGGRNYIRRACEASLARLQTDYLDLYQQHTPDPSVPIEETLGALGELVDEGKVRFIGHSNFDAAQAEAADAAAARLGGHRFVSAQNELSPLARAVESDLMPTLRRIGVGLLPYFPLANGLLTGKYARDHRPEGTRIVNDKPGLLEGVDWDQLAAYQAICDAAGAPMSQVTFAWLLTRPGLVSVIAGATSPGQVIENAAAASVRLPGDLVAAIDELFTVG